MAAQRRSDSTEPGGDGPAGMPTWVKVFLAVAIALALAFLVTRLSGVEHGPGLHGPGGAGSGPPSADSS